MALKFNIKNTKSIVKASKAKDQVKEALTKKGFVFKNEDKYILGKIQGGDIIWVRLYAARIEVYPVGNYDAWKSNSIRYEDIDLSKDILVQLLKNIKK